MADANQVDAGHESRFFEFGPLNPCGLDESLEVSVQVVHPIEAQVPAVLTRQLLSINLLKPVQTITFRALRRLAQKFVEAPTPHGA